MTEARARYGLYIHAGEWSDLTGLSSMMTSRIVKAGVLRPTRMWPNSDVRKGNAFVFDSKDYAIVSVWISLNESHTREFSDEMTKLVADEVYGDRVQDGQVCVLVPQTSEVIVMDELPICWEPTQTVVIINLSIHTSRFQLRDQLTKQRKAR